MRRRTVLFLAWSFISAIVCALTLLAPASAAARQANILVIISDDMGYGDVGFHGSKEIPTPHLDALAASGIRFTDAYVSAPYCSPSRAGLMTGRYGQRFGYEYNPKSPDLGLPSSEITVAQRLKSAGYITGHIGKWNLGEEAVHHPQRFGFDEFFGFLGGGHDYYNSKSILRGTTPVKEKAYLTDAFGREAEAFIAAHNGKPWFLYLSFNGVHTPLQADDAKIKQFAHIADESRRIYAAMLSRMDDVIGSVLRKLADTGVERDTLVIFLNDNGGPTVAGTAENSSSNAPLRGGKRTTLEGGIRVPFIMSWPSRLKPALYRESIISLDIAPTALAVAGVEPLTDVKFDGVNLLPFLAGERKGSPHDALYWRLGPQMAIRSGDYKLVRYDDVVDSGLDKGNRSRETRFDVTPPKLYRVTDDASESKDLTSAMPEKVRELQSKWDKWSATLAKPKWTDARINGTNPKPAAKTSGKK